MASRFQNSRNRLDRAYVHYQSFIAECSSVMDAKSASTEARKDKRAGWHIISAKPTAECIERMKASPLALQLGEIAYQLRAALDGLIWEAVSRTQGSEPTPDAKGLHRLEFPLSPIWKAADIDQNRFHGFPFPQNLIDWMRSIQPGAADKPIGHPDYGLANTLEDIHNLARFDRHRRLRIVAVIPTDSSVEVVTDPPGGNILAHEWIDCDLFNGKYDFLRLRAVAAGGLVPLNIRYKTKMTFEVWAEDMPRYDASDIGTHIGRFIQAVERVVVRFEEEFF